MHDNKKKFYCFILFNFFNWSIWFLQIEKKGKCEKKYIFFFKKKVIYENKVLKFTLCLIRLHLSCILFIYFLILGHMLCSKDFKIQNL